MQHVVVIVVVTLVRLKVGGFADRFSTAVFVYFAQRVHEMFTFRFGRYRRRRLLLRIGRGVRGGWPNGWQQFLRPRVELFGRLLVLVVLLRRRRHGTPKKLFFLFETLLDPGHDDRVVGLGRSVVHIIDATGALKVTRMDGRRRRFVIDLLHQQSVTACHSDVHAVSRVRVAAAAGGRRRRLRLVSVVRRRIVGAPAAVCFGGRRASGVGRSVRRHESGRRDVCAAADAVAVVMVLPRVLVDRTGIAAAVETQFAARCHSRFQAAWPLVCFGIVSGLAKILQRKISIIIYVIIL